MSKIGTHACINVCCMVGTHVLQGKISSLLVIVWPRESCTGCLVMQSSHHIKWILILKEMDIILVMRLRGTVMEFNALSQKYTE
jgi:hypothetical protein